LKAVDESFEMSIGVVEIERDEVVLEGLHVAVKIKRDTISLDWVYDLAVVNENEPEANNEVDKFKLRGAKVDAVTSAMLAGTGLDLLELVSQREKGSCLERSHSWAVFLLSTLGRLWWEIFEPDIVEILLKRVDVAMNELEVLKGLQMVLVHVCKVNADHLPLNASETVFLSTERNSTSQASEPELSNNKLYVSKIFVNKI
jgi:hypothetical protein